MKKLKCIAVDDEPLAVDLILDNINRIPFLECSASFNSAAKAAEYLRTNTADLLFLDIQMPDLNGMEFAKTIPGQMIIFTTAFENYAIKGFELQAVDYILKPFTYPRFEKACLKAKEFHDLKTNTDRPQSIIIRSEHKSIRLNLDSIIYIEGLKDYVKIYIEGEDKPILTRTNLKGIGDQLPSQQFKRVHKSFLVNFSRVSGIDSSNVLLQKTKIPIGEVYKTEIRKLFNC